MLKAILMQYQLANQSLKISNSQKFYNKNAQLKDPKPKTQYKNSSMLNVKLRCQYKNLKKF